MCGICGYIHLDRSKRPSEDILKAMTGTLVHRGPDAEGYYLKNNVALGHRRLSIIDLKTGDQPMSNEDGSLVIVYNGEVYNFPEIKKSLSEKGHAFRTGSDTEVVIHAYEEYGEACLEHFNGMFAFAIWDSRKNRLFVARDRFGVKPLYYAVFDNQFIFGSELKAILKHPAVTKEIDMTALAKYLVYEYVPTPLSIFKGINKLESASKLILEGNGTVKVERYWDLEFKTAGSFDLGEAEARLKDLLKESVRKRLISDVPLGVFLSGGIDSSTVVAMMAELMPPKSIKTFSIGFAEEHFNELGDARRVANHFGTDHHEEMLNPKKMLEVFPKILDLLDEPFADSSIIPTYLVSAFARNFVTVALGGDGGDEQFLGYNSFKAHKLYRYINFLPRSLKVLFFELLSMASPVSYDRLGLNYRARRFLRGIDFPDEIRHQAWIGTFVPEEEKELFSRGAGLDLDQTSIYEKTSALYKKIKGADPLNRLIYMYTHTYMTDDGNVKVDRASMANSLEVRAPFFDTDLVQFAATIPSSFKLKGLATKWILKDAMKDKLPAETLSKSKKGFGVPVAKWLKEDLKDLLSEAFDRKKIEREGIFNYAYIDGMLGDYFANRRDLRKEIWALFLFEMWYDRWMK